MKSPRLLSHAYNAPALRGDFIVTYLPSQPKEVPNLSSVTLPYTRHSANLVISQPVLDVTQQKAYNEASHSETIYPLMAVQSVQIDGGATQGMLLKWRRQLLSYHSGQSATVAMLTSRFDFQHAVFY